MKIDILCNDGSPLGVTEQSIYGIDGRSGVGGAELALLTMCKLWHERGDDVTLYNNPNVIGGSIFKQSNLRSFVPEDDRGILIIFRSPTTLINRAKGRKIWWSCDQRTNGDFVSFYRYVDALVGISQCHKEFFNRAYGIVDMKIIDIPVRTWEYPVGTPKKKNSFIFTSVPDRGLMQLLPIWNRIVEEIPDATLTITSDWSLWTGGRDVHTMPYRLKWASAKGVNYVGAVKREELIRIQSESEYHLYPCTYEELFCISVAESQVAGCVPVTSMMGAVDTTNRFGVKVQGSPESQEFINDFVDKVLLLSRSGIQNSSLVQNPARNEFSPERALTEWDKVLNG